MTLPAWIEYRDRSGNTIATFSQPAAIESAMRLVEKGVLSNTPNFQIHAFDREGMPIHLEGHGD